MGTLVSQILISAILLWGIYTLISIGVTLIFGVMRIVNFAHGEFLMFGMYFSFWFFQLFGWDPYASLFLVTIFTVIISCIVYKTVINKTMGKSDLPQVFATLGVGIVMQNLAYIFWSGNYRTVRTGYADAALAFQGLLVSIPHFLVFITAILVSGAMYVFLKYTTPGKAIRAIAQNSRAAALMGVNVSRMYLITFAIGTGLAGVAGAGIMPIFAVYPMVGFDLILVAFIICVLGGIGSIPGAIIGSFIIALIETLSGFFIAESMKQVVYFLIFIIILIVKPSGILGQKGEAFLHR